jgi:Protein of unknown function (DUF3572)
MLRPSGKSVLSRQNAEEIAIRALSFLANDPEHMSRFMALSGMEPDDIAKNAASSFFQVALLEHLMGDEALLLTFCGNENIAPELIAPAHHILEG